MCFLSGFSAVSWVQPMIVKIIANNVLISPELPELLVCFLTCLQYLVKIGSKLVSLTFFDMPTVGLSPVKIAWIIALKWRTS